MLIHSRSMSVIKSSSFLPVTFIPKGSCLLCAFALFRVLLGLLFTLIIVSLFYQIIKTNFWKSTTPFLISDYLNLSFPVILKAWKSISSIRHSGQSNYTQSYSVSHQKYQAQFKSLIYFILL